MSISASPPGTVELARALAAAFAAAETLREAIPGVLEAIGVELGCVAGVLENGHECRRRISLGDIPRQDRWDEAKDCHEPV